MTLDLRRWRRDITPTDLTIADFFAGIGGTNRSMRSARFLCAHRINLALSEILMRSPHKSCAQRLTLCRRCDILDIRRAGRQAKPSPR